MIGKRTALICTVILIALSGTALGVDIKASVDKTVVGVGDAITLTLTITGKGGSLADPNMPDLPDFEVYQSGRSQNISIINGAFSSSLSMTYVLVPRKVGQLMIGPIVARDSEGMSSTDPIKITVTQQAQGGSQAGQGRQTPQQVPRTQPPQKGGDFFIDQTVDKSNPYVGEQVTLTFRFFQGVNLWDQPSLEWPKYNGLTVEDLPPNSRYYQAINGRRYLVTEIKRAIFPLSSGKLVVDSPQLTIKPDDFGSAFDPFGFFDANMRDLMKRGQPKILTASPITLNVRPLPETGKPSDFTGAVGKFSMNVQTDKDSVGVDEPITLKVILSGTGNIRSLPPIKLPDLPDFRIYDSGNTESVSNSNQIISGTKTFEQAIIPKTSGKFEIPVITLSYFDPSSGTYKNLSTGPIRIVASGEGLADVGGAPKNIIGAGKLSLGYIITDFPKSSRPVDLSSSFWFWFLQVLPMAAIVAAIYYRVRSQKLLADRGYARRVRASRRLKSIFKSAGEFRARGELEGFYGALYDAVLGFVADRKNLEKTGLTIEQVRENQAISEDLRCRLADFLERCQNARFAPGGAAANHAESLLTEASGLVSELEKAI